MIRFSLRCKLAVLRRAFAVVCGSCHGAEFENSLVCGKCSRLAPAELAVEKSAFEILGM